jgi:hypothetical protein
MPAAKKKIQPPWYIVKSSSIHSHGVFAARDIPKETYIIEYTGERITKKESERRAQARLQQSKKTGEAAVYIFTLNDEWDLDGSLPGNTARLINHSCDPNCEAWQDEEDRIWIVAIRSIKKNEELTFNYGFDLENWDTHVCLCGSNDCVGFIVDQQYWPELKKLIQNKNKSVGKVGKKKN